MEEKLREKLIQLANDTLECKSCFKFVNQCALPDGTSLNEPCEHCEPEQANEFKATILKLKKKQKSSIKEEL